MHRTISKSKARKSRERWTVLVLDLADRSQHERPSGTYRTHREALRRYGTVCSPHRQVRITMSHEG